MKGYLVLIIITIILLCGLPVCLVKPVPDEEASEAPSSSFILQDDEGRKSRVNAIDFVTYATLNLLSPQSHDEAIKAVAAAVYTLGVYQSLQEEPLQPIGSYPQSYTDEYWHEQWGDTVYQTHMSHIRGLVSEAIRTPITYDGQPIMAVIHAMNNGKTDSAQEVWGHAVPYLVSVDSIADANDPNGLTTHVVSQTDTANVLKTMFGDDIPATDEWFLSPITSTVGTVKSMRFGEKTLSGTAIQEAFSLPSSVFSVSVQENQVIFTVQGNGHFVGMSLCGCVAMAENGLTWKDILRHYYSGITI